MGDADRGAASAGGAGVLPDGAGAAGGDAQPAAVAVRHGHGRDGGVAAVGNGALLANSITYCVAACAWFFLKRLLVEQLRVVKVGNFSRLVCIRHVACVYVLTCTSMAGRFW